eukprot:65162_1
MDDADRPEKIVKKGRGLMKRQAAAGKSKKPAALSGVPKTAHGVAKGTQRLAETRISRSKPAQKETTTDFRGPRSFKDIMHEKKAEAIRQKLLASKRKREDEAAKSGIESPVIPGSPTRTGSVQSRESSKEPTSTGVVGSKQSAGVMRSKQSTGVTRSKQSTGSTSRTKRSLSRERKSPPKRKRSNSLTTSTRPPKHRIKPVSAKPAASPPTQYQMPSRSTNSAQLFGVSPTPQAMQRLAAFPIKPVIQSQNVMVRPPAVPFRNQGQALFTTPVVGHDSSPPFMQAGVVHPMSPQRLPVHPVSQPRTQPQLFQTRNQPQMSQPRSQPQLFQNRNQPQMSQPRTQPQLFQNRNQPQMSQTRNQSQMSQPRTQPQLFQTRNQPQMSHPHNQSQASQSRNQSQELVSRPRKQSQVSQSPNKSQLSRPRNQSQVSHSRNQSPVSRPRKQQQSGVPAGLFTSSQQMDSSSDIISLTNKLASPNKPASVVSKSTGVVSKPTGVVSKPVGASQPAGIASSWPVSSKASNTAKRPAVLMSDSGQKYTKSKASKTLEATQSSKSASQKPPMMKRRRLQPISEAQQTTPAYEKTSGVILRANVSPPVDKDRVVGQPSETSHTKPVMTPSHSTRDDPEWASSPREPSGVSSKPSDIGSKPAKPADSGSKPAKQADSGLKPGIAIESASQPKIDNPKSIPSSKQISVPQISPTSDKHQLNRSTETSSNASSDSDDLAKPTPFSAQTIAPKITTSQSKPIKSKRDDISPPKNPKQSPDMSRRRVSTNSPSKHHDILRHIMQSSANPSVNNRSTSVKQPKGRKSLPSGPTKPISPSERRTISPKVPSPVSDSLSAGKNMPVVSDTQSGSNVFHPEPASPIRGPRNTIRPASKPFLTESPESKVLYVLSDSDASSQVAESPANPQETSASQVSTTAKVHQTAPHAPATAPHVPATVPQFSASAPQFSASAPQVSVAAPQVSVAAPQQSTTKPAVMPGVSQTKVSQQSRPSQTVNCERSRPTSTKTQLEANKDLIQFLRDQQLFKQYIDTLAANRKSFLNKLRSRPDYNEIEAKVRATPRAQRAEQTARFVRAQLIRRHESTDELSEMLRRGLPREQRELIVSSGNMSATEVNALASQVPEFMKRILGRIDRGK